MKCTAVIEKGPTSYGRLYPGPAGLRRGGGTREEVVSLITRGGSSAPITSEEIAVDTGR